MTRRANGTSTTIRPAAIPAAGQLLETRPDLAGLSITAAVHDLATSAA